MQSFDWKDFHENYFGKKPLVIKGALKAPIASEEEIFRALVEAARDRFKYPDMQIRFYAGGGQISAGVDDWLPRAADGSLNAYLDRISPRLNGQGFGLLNEEIQAFLGFDFFDRLRTFYGGLIDRAGIPNGRSMCEVFMGNYRNTPFGVHKDTADVFAMVIRGKKRMRLWPYEVYAGKPAYFMSNSYEKDLDRSILLEGEPGDILTWPSSYWHVGESDGSFSLSLHFGYFHGCEIVNRMTGALKQKAMAGFYEQYNAQKIIRADDIERYGLEVQERMQAASRDLRRAALEAGLKARTGVGFTRTPLPLEEGASVLGDESKVHVLPSFPIAWRRHRRELLVSANGHVFALPYSPAFVFLIRELNRGGRGTVTELCARQPADERIRISAGAVKHFLQLLVATGGLKRA
jgi:50S ribosomal protein L16 3-hydroxylase